MKSAIYKEVDMNVISVEVVNITSLEADDLFQLLTERNCFGVVKTDAHRVVEVVGRLGDFLVLRTSYEGRPGDTSKPRLQQYPGDSKVVRLQGKQRIPRMAHILLRDASKNIDDRIRSLESKVDRLSRS